MLLAGKVEETPVELEDVIIASYERIHKKDLAGAQREVFFILLILQLSLSIYSSFFEKIYSFLSFAYKVLFHFCRKYMSNRKSLY